MKKFKTSKLFKSVMALVLAFSMFFSVPVTANAAGAQGVDVSKYQGAINWAAVAQSGISYAYIKVGSAKSGIDPFFAQNVKNAQAAGIRTGVYIYSYATSVEAAAAEAQMVLQWIDGYNINFPVTFDFEDRTQKGLDANTCTAMANTFCSIIAAAGYTPVLYTYTNFYKTHFTSALAFDKWIAQYSDHNDIPGWAVWQYTSGGAVPGINGRVDMNLAAKDYAAFIPMVGLLDLGEGNRFFYNNYRRQFGWIDIAGIKYHTDPLSGLVTSGWYTEPALGTYYFSPATANAVVGLNTIDKGIYYFNEQAQLQVGWLELGGNTFYFNPAENGKLYTGWFRDPALGVRYLDTTDGHMLKGLAVIDKDMYYFNDQGLMQVGWVDVNGLTYLFNPNDNGKMYRGWWQDATGKYYLDKTDAHRVTGLAAIDGSFYYFNEKGQMQVGAVDVKGNVYFFGPDGKMQTGFKQVGNGTYYFGDNGVMVKGVVAAKDGVYYADPKTGLIVVNQVVKIANQNFLFGEDGKLVKNQMVQIGNMAYQTDDKGVVIAQAKVQ